MSMRIRVTVILTILCASTGAIAGTTGADTLRYVPSRDVVIDYRPANDTEITEVELWVSADSGRTWDLVDTIADDGQTLRYAAPADGKYDFYLVLRNDAGSSADPPEPGAKPAVSVVVDTVPPLLQIHATLADHDFDGTPIVTMDATLVEENLTDDGLRVFYRTIPERWLDGGRVTFDDDRLLWFPPEPLDTFVDLRVIATDRAGNRTSSEAFNIEIMPFTPAAANPFENLAPDAPSSPTALGGFQPVQPPVVAPVQPPIVAPFTRAPATDPQQSERTLPPPVDDNPNLPHLRELAAQFLAEGRYSLAAARFEDAVRSAPHDADLRVDLGSALYRVGRYDDAATRFQSALDTLPDHMGAIEGLALVAATQKQYPLARQHLEHLLKLQPDSGQNWLRYGDVQHRLGNTAQALQAWQRVLSVVESDEDLHKKSQRRLDYFGGNRTSEPATTNGSWQSAQKPRPSSSSTATTTTANPRR